MVGKLVVTLAMLAAVAGAGWMTITTRRAGNTGLPPPGHGWVADLPSGRGLQFCLNLPAKALAPARARYFQVYSLSAAITTTLPESVSEAMAGRYPGWDTGATIYDQPFTNFNGVFVGIQYNGFHPGMDCMEVYGHHLIPARYRSYSGHVVVGYSYFYRGRGRTFTDLFPVAPGPYLPKYSPQHRPKH